MTAIGVEWRFFWFSLFLLFWRVTINFEKKTVDNVNTPSASWATTTADRPPAGPDHVPEETQATQRITGPHLTTG
jgi:hypothetical protein